jgi:hypothetical protein
MEAKMAGQRTALALLPAGTAAAGNNLLCSPGTAQFQHVMWLPRGWALCRPLGTRLINLIVPGTDVPGYRLYRPYGTGFVAVFKSLRTFQTGCEKDAVAGKKRPSAAKAGPVFNQIRTG